MLKGIFVLMLLGTAVYWIFGPVALLALVGVAIVGFVIMDYQATKWAEEARIESEAQKKARHDMLMSMTKQERREFAEKERAEREEQERQARAKIQAQREADRRARAQREQNLRERELAVREKAVAEAEKGKKVPLAAKLATAGVVGYKVGKHIGKW